MNDIKRRLCQHSDPDLFLAKFLNLSASAEDISFFPQDFRENHSQTFSHRMHVKKEILQKETQ